MNFIKKSLLVSFVSCLLFGSACSDSKSECSADVMDIERHRIELCQDRLCGDVVFADVCGSLHTKSCGACLAGESCTSQGRCASCTSDEQCSSGYFCGASFSCEKHENYCETTVDCIGKGGGVCADNLCIAVDVSCGNGTSCNLENNEICISGTCKRVISLTECSATGSTTLASTVVRAYEEFDGPEQIYTYTSGIEELILVSVTPTDLSYDPAVYVLTRLTPSPVLLSDDGGREVVVADEDVRGKSELLMFTVKSGATYYIVVSSDTSKQSGQYKQGHYSICIESLSCTATCETK